MKYDNIKYLVFDREGELIDPENKDRDSNVIQIENYTETSAGNKIDLTIDFGPCLQIQHGSSTLCIVGYADNVSLFDVVAKSMVLHLGCGEVHFHSVRIGGEYYSAIIYNECFDSVGYHLFYDWMKFFLPNQPPSCNCGDSNLNESLLPYANKVRKSMCKFFNLDHIYGNCVVTKDLRVSFCGVEDGKNGTITKSEIKNSDDQTLNKVNDPEQCPKCGCQVTDPFGFGTVMHDVESCLGLTPDCEANDLEDEGMAKKYDSYAIRCKTQILKSETEEQLMNILMEFGSSIDPYGSDGGDYDTAMEKILEIIATR